MPTGLQAKLLRFLQDKQFERVGETRTRTADVRIVAATNRDLEADVRSGAFREDLLFRLNVVEVTVPPLRERREDILPLARRFLAFFARAARKAPPELSPRRRRRCSRTVARQRARAAQRHRARGDPRRRAGPRAGAFPERIVGHAADVPAVGGDFTVEALEREHILASWPAPDAGGGRAVLGIDASTLWRKRKRYEGRLRPPQFLRASVQFARSPSQAVLQFARPSAPPPVRARRIASGG